MECRDEGCSREADLRGLCRMHYMRLWRRGLVEPAFEKRSLQRRRRRKSAATPEEAVAWELRHAVRHGFCKLASGARCRAVYPAVRVAGRPQRLNRLVLAVKLGRELAPGEIARHTCDTPACINPDHLVAGSAADNARGRRGTSVTWGDVGRIRRRYGRGGVTQADLAAEYGLGLTTIWNIINYRTWT